MEGVKKIREEQGLSLRELAARSGITKTTILGIEHGRHSPTVDTLQRLADAMGVEVVDFFVPKVRKAAA